MCSEKAALHVEDEDEMPNAWASPYDSIRRGLSGASAPMVQQVETTGGELAIDDIGEASGY